MGYVGFAFTTSALDFLVTVPPKTRRQIIKKAKALHTNPFPPGCKKLQGVECDGAPVYRERSGDYRILYVVKSKPDEVLILDIDHRKDVYKMPKTKDDATDRMQMKEEDFDRMMRGALEVASPPPKKPEPSGEKPAPEKEATKGSARKRTAAST